MVLDAVSNFVRGNTDAEVGTEDTTVSVVDASIFPDPETDGEFNVVIWDVNNFPRPDQDGDVEILRVTERDTTADELTVVRGQETTSAAAHPEGSAIQLSPTAKMFSDIESTFGDFWDAGTQELTGDVNNTNTTTQGLEAGSVNTDEVNNIRYITADDDPHDIIENADPYDWIIADPTQEHVIDDRITFSADNARLTGLQFRLADGATNRGIVMTGEEQVVDHCIGDGNFDGTDPDSYELWGIWAGNDEREEGTGSKNALIHACTTYGWDIGQRVDGDGGSIRHGRSFNCWKDCYAGDTGKNLTMSESIGWNSGARVFGWGLEATNMQCSNNLVFLENTLRENPPGDRVDGIFIGDGVSAGEVNGNAIITLDEDDEHLRGIHLGTNTEYIHVADNTIWEPNNNGIWLRGEKQTVENNTIIRPNRGINVNSGGTPEQVIRGNTIIEPSPSEGIDINLNDTIVEDNTVIDPQSQGIRFDTGSDGSLVKDNTVIQCSNSAAIDATDSADDVRIIGNVIKDGDMFSAIRVEADNPLIKNNIIEGCDSKGVVVFGERTGARIERNDVKDVTDEGIEEFDDDVDGSLIRQNTLQAIGSDAVVVSGENTVAEDNKEFDGTTWVDA